MIVKFLENITPNIYKAIKGLEGVTIYHTKEWHNFLHRTFNWSTKAIIGLAENGELIFFLPFISKCRTDFKKHNISLPLSHKVGLAVRKDYFPNIDCIISEIKKILNDIEIHIEINSPDMEIIYLYDETILDLTKYKNIDELYRNLDYTSIRYRINRAKKNNIIISNELSEENFEYFYRLEVETRIRQGSPIYPRSFFKNLLSCLKDTGWLSIYIAFYNRKPISGSIFLHFQNHSIYAYSASVTKKEIKKIGANELILWSGILESYSLGKQYFDFGTSSIALPKLRLFKEKWGGKSRPLLYSYYTKGRQPKIISRSSIGTKIASVLLKWMPKSIFKVIGPCLLKLIV